MKTKLLIFSIAMVLCVNAVSVMADYDAGAIVVDRLSGYYSGPGGEFTVSAGPVLTTIDYSDLVRNIYINNTTSLGTMTYSFQTFCLEKDELVNPPSDVIEKVTVNEYWSGGVQSDAVQGGTGGPTPDPIDPKTAYLYTQFATGVLLGYDYNPAGSRTSDAAALQQAIWFIEEEDLTPLSGDALTFYNDAVTNAGSGIGSVRVINLENQVPGGFTDAQDMLYLVPVPAAVLLGMLGLGVAGIKLRKYA